MGVRLGLWVFDARFRDGSDVFDPVGEGLDEALIEGRNEGVGLERRGGAGPGELRLEELGG